MPVRRSDLTRERIYDPSNAAPPRRLSRKFSFILQLLSVFAVAFLVYFNTLYNGFVFDDDAQVLRNPWIRSIRHVPEIFFSGVWRFRGMTSNYYRPLMHITNMISYALFGLKPWGFHLVNVLFHAGNSVLVYIVAARLIGESSRHRAAGTPPSPPQDHNSPSSPPEITPPSPPLSLRGGRVGLRGDEGRLSGGVTLRGRWAGLLLFPPFIVAVLFASHPIHTEAVAWVAGLPDVAFAFFYLLSFYLYMRSEGGYGFRYALSVLSFFCATLYKEPALTLPVMLVAYDFAFGEDTFLLRPGSRIRRYVPYFIGVCIYFLLRFNALGGFAPYNSHPQWSAFQYVINVFPIFVQYLGKLILPVNLNVYPIFHPAASLFEMKVIIPLFLTAAFAAFAYVSAKKNRTAFLGLLFIAVPLMPALYLPGLGDNLFAERYLYLPSAGFLLLLGLLLDRLRAAKRSAALLLTAVFVAILVFYTLGTIERNTVWRSNYSLWSDTVKKSPDSAIPHGDLGLALSSDPRRLDEAMEQLRIAIALASRSDSITERNNLASFFDNLGSVYSAKGWEDKAIEQYRTAIRVDPSYVDAYNNLGVSYLELGRVDEGIQLFQAAVRLRPDLAETHNNLGLAYLKKGLTDQAVVQFREAVRLEPRDPGYYYGLADAYRMKGLYDRAEEAVRRGKSLEGR
jgi:tetratricopeptide (TPR) repeat protein